MEVLEGRWMWRDGSVSHPDRRRRWTASLELYRPSMTLEEREKESSEVCDVKRERERESPQRCLMLRKRVRESPQRCVMLREREALLPAFVSL